MESMSLLSMLAEIASEKLQTDPTVKMITKCEENKNFSNIYNSDSGGHYNQGKKMTLLQVSNISDNNILRLFSINQANELKRKFYFTCRLIPQYCEETFQSFGSEEKARNLMKKHLKEHLSNLLEEFKDHRSRESYIFHTVESSRSCSNSDSRSISRRSNKLKLDAKTKKLSQEKENSRLHNIKAINSHHNINADSKVISNNMSINNNVQVQKTSSFKSKKLERETFNQRKYKDIQKSSPTKSHFSSGLNSQNDITTLSHNNSDLLDKKLIKTIYLKEESNFEEIPNSQQSQQSSNVQNFNIESTYNADFYQFENNIGIAVQSDAFEMKNNSVLPSTHNNELSCSIPASHAILVNNSVQSYKICNQKFENCAISTVQEQAPKRAKTDIVDIQEEESFKLELLSPIQQPNQINCTVSHDHHYISGEEADIQQVKSFSLNCEAIKHEDEILKDNGSAMQNKEISGAATSTAIAADSNEESICQNEKRKKVRRKGRGKFIGQSKNEKEMALGLIEKLKSQPHMQLESLECKICNPPRVFTAPATLLSHYKSHAGIRPYMCLICEAVFTRQHSLNYHYLIHLNQTRFTCIDCGRKFRHPSHFKEHLRRHTGESPYECVDCLMRFKTRNTYKRHLRTRHGKKLTTQGLIHSITEGSQTIENHQFQKQIKIENNEPEIKIENSEPDEIIRDAEHSIRNANTEFSELTNLSNSIVNTNSNGNSNDNSNDLHWPNVVSFDTQDYLTCQLVSDQKFDSELDSNISNLHEMLPLQLSQLENAECYSKNNRIESSLPATIKLCPDESSFISATVPVSYIGEDQDMSNILRNDNKILVVNETASHSETENTNFRNMICNQVDNSEVFSSSTVDYMPVGKNSLLQTSEMSCNIEIPTRTILLDQHLIANRNSRQSVISDNSQKNLQFINSSSPSNSFKHLNLSTGGSILGALLTSGNGKGLSTNALRSSLIGYNKDLRVNSLKTCVGEHSNSDKWDSLMREVVSLSTAVKEKSDDKIEIIPDAQAISRECYSNNIITPVQELGNNVFRFNRVEGKAGQSEIFILRYSNGASGNQITKIFKANLPLETKEVVVTKQREKSDLDVHTKHMFVSNLSYDGDQRKQNC